MEIKKFTRLSLLLALAVVLNIIENMIPIFNGWIPGLKLGLANIIILTILYTYSWKDALYVSILRVFLVGILYSGIFSIAFFFSLGGALFSLFMMTLTKKFTPLSMVGVSIIGSIFHSIGQILIACLLLKTTTMIYYLPFMLLLSIPTGIMTGMVSKEFVKSLSVS